MVTLLFVFVFLNAVLCREMNGTILLPKGSAKHVLWVIADGMRAIYGSHHHGYCQGCNTAYEETYDKNNNR